MKAARGHAMGVLLGHGQDLPIKNVVVFPGWHQGTFRAGRWFLALRGYDECHATLAGARVNF